MQRDGMSCWEQLGAILAWEYQDAELFAEHFYTVACYNLQHPAKFTDKALRALRQGFLERLDKGMSTQELRRRMSNSFEGKTRILKEEKERHPGLKVWTMTVADVYLPHQPEGAAERVREWARLIRREM